MISKGIKKALEFREHYPLLNPVSLSDKLFDSANMRIIFESAKKSGIFSATFL
jgi:hypothetical protein